MPLSISKFFAIIFTHFNVCWVYVWFLVQIYVAHVYFLFSIRFVLVVRRAFSGILQMDFSQFLNRILSLDTSSLSARHCLSFIAELAFSAASSSSSSAASSTSAPVANGPSSVILLGVDEISKSKWENKLLNLIGSISDSPLILSNGLRVAVLPIVTSLSQTLMAKQETESSRPLSLISLPVHLPGAADMLVNQLNLAPDFLPIIRVMCRSLSNHGRLLEVLHDLLKSGSVYFQQLVAGRENAISSILRAVIADNRGSAYLGILTRSSRDMLLPVCHALLGTSLDRDERLQNCAWTPDQLQMNGVFIGDATSKKGNITPIISPLQLLLWSERLIARSDFSELHPLANALVDVFSIKAPFTWSKFESFHAGMQREHAHSSYLLVFIPLIYVNICICIHFSTAFQFFS